MHVASACARHQWEHLEAAGEQIVRLGVGIGCLKHEREEGLLPGGR